MRTQPNTYQYEIRGKFAAAGPVRRTKLDAQRHADATRKAKGRKASQKVLKDLRTKALRAKVLRAQGKSVTERAEGSKAKEQKSKQCAKNCRLGFKSDGKPLFGTIVKDQWGFRWRTQYRIDMQSFFISTPYRSSWKEASDDYIQLYQAQEGMANETKRRAIIHRVVTIMHQSKKAKQTTYQCFSTSVQHC